MIGFSFSRLGAILGKEFVQMRRDRITFAMMLGVPIMQLLLFGFAINNDPKGLPTALLNMNNGRYARAIITAMDAHPLPPGYAYRFGGSTKDMQESFGYAISALVMGVVFIYMILASQFRSFLQPLALMSSLPLTLIGVVLALLLFRSTLNMFSIIGIVMLMGLVTKNAILLIDFAIRAQHDGMERTQALLQAAHVRLRPILMTTLAMIFGMLPLALALSEGSEQRAPMGQAVIGGVITSSLLTLVVVPVIYCYLDDLSLWAKARWAARPGVLQRSTST